MKHIQKNVDRLFSQIVENRELSHMKPLTITSANIGDLVRKLKETLNKDPFFPREVMRGGYVGEFAGFSTYISSPYKSWIETI